MRPQQTELHLTVVAIPLKQNHHLYLVLMHHHPCNCLSLGAIHSISSFSEHIVERLALESDLRKAVPMRDCLIAKIHQNTLVPLKTQLNENYFLRPVKRGNDKI